jgi:hypothetical protein
VPSLAGYHKALAAGLQRRAAYAVLPSAAEPFYLVPLDCRGVVRCLFDTILDSGGVLQAVRVWNLAPFY